MSIESPTREARESQPVQERRPFGLLAEFANEDALRKAARQVRDAGYKRWDCHAPFPVHGLDGAMGIRRTFLPWLALGGGIAGCVVGLGMQLWMNGIDYPFLISDKPLFSVPAFIPITFELTVLLAAFGAFFGMLILNNLPMHYHPLHASDRFRRATSDGFFISIESADPQFDVEKTQRLLNGAGAVHVEMLEP